MSKPKTLLILTPGFPANEADSTCVPPQQLFVKALKEQYPELQIIVLTLQYPFTRSNYNWHGVQVIAFGGQNKGQRSRMLLWIEVWQTLKKLNKEHNLAGILSFWLGECAFIGNRFAKGHKLKHYCWMLGQDARPGNKYVKLTKAKGEWLIALSDSLAKEFHKNYGIDPAHIIPPGIDVSVFGSPTADRTIDIMGAGSLIALKQFDLFIEVIETLVDNFPDLKVVICGGGPQMEKLKGQVIAANLEGNIQFKGELPHNEVLALMQRSSIFLHTSAYEGFGMVLSEALYAGAQVVSLLSPMDRMPASFHKANHKQSIINITTNLLNDDKLSHKPVLMYPISTIAQKMAELFI